MDKTRRDNLIWVWVISSLAMIFWLVSFIGAPPRFGMLHLQASYWHFVAIGGNLLLALVVLVLKKRSLLIIPLFFLMQPLSYALMEPIHRMVIGPTFSSLEQKLLADASFFVFELLCFLPLLLLLPKGEKNPLRFRGFKELPPLEPHQGVPHDKFFPVLKIFNPWSWARFFKLPLDPETENHRLVRSHHRRVLLFFMAAIMGGVLAFLAIINPKQENVSYDLVAKILPFQLLFGLLLGFKEEIIFRWIGLKGAEHAGHSRTAGALIMALAWGLYHAFFAEGMGPNGPWTFWWAFFVSCYFSYMVYELKNVWVPSILHVLIELFAFWIIYGPVAIRLGLT